MPFVDAEAADAGALGDTALAHLNVTTAEGLGAEAACLALLDKALRSMMKRFSFSYSSCEKMPLSRRALAISKSSYICLTLDILWSAQLEALTHAAQAACARPATAKDGGRRGHDGQGE